MVEIREVDANGDSSTGETYACSFCKVYQLLLLDSLHQPGNNEEKNDEQIVLCHLHMVGIDLECREDSCE